MEKVTGGVLDNTVKDYIASFISVYKEQGSDKIQGFFIKRSESSEMDMVTLDEFKRLYLGRAVFCGLDCRYSAVSIVGKFLYTGTSVNPARSIGPALFEGGKALSQLWVFIVGPLAGAALAALVYKFLEKGEA